MVRLRIGDHFIDSGVVAERKTYADFAPSLVAVELDPNNQNAKRQLERLRK